MEIDLVSAAGVALATGILAQAVLALIAPAPATRDRIGPALAIVIAVLLAEIAALATGGDPVAALATGIAGAAGAMAAHDTLAAAGTGA